MKRQVRVPILKRSSLDGKDPEHHGSRPLERALLRLAGEANPRRRGFHYRLWELWVSEDNPRCSERALAAKLFRLRKSLGMSPRDLDKLSEQVVLPATIEPWTEEGEPEPSDEEEIEI